MVKTNLFRPDNDCKPLEKITINENHCHFKLIDNLSELKIHDTSEIGHNDIIIQDSRHFSFA